MNKYYAFLICIILNSTVVARTVTAEIDIIANIPPTCDIDINQHADIKGLKLTNGTHEVHAASLVVECNTVKANNAEIIVNSENSFKLKLDGKKKIEVPYTMTITGQGKLVDINASQKKIIQQSNKTINTYEIYLKYTASNLEPGLYNEQISFTVQFT